MKNKKESLKPKIKFNGGKGAVLCNNCSVIISVGFEYKELFCSDKCKKEWKIKNQPL